MKKVVVTMHLCMAHSRILAYSTREKDVIDPTKQWVRRSGEVVNICEMNDGHIKNAILMLIREGNTDHESYDSLVKEYRRRSY